MKAVMIGSGNVATHIAPALEKIGFHWVQVYSRNIGHARTLADALDSCVAIDHLEDIDTTAQWYFLAVSDAALPVLASTLRLGQAKVVHFSGSVPLDTIKPISSCTGVMYFFQTFSKGAGCPSLEATPVCIEASQNSLLQELTEMASRISNHVIPMDSRQRGLLHLSGVFACNYANLMFGIAHDVLEAASLDYTILFPLMEETLVKARRVSDPFLVQTGPAVRNDVAVLDRHQWLLGQDSDLQDYGEVYRILAEAIRRKSVKHGKL